MAIQLFVPTIGTRLVLAEPWTFDLHQEPRNCTMFKVLGFKDAGSYTYNFLKMSNKQFISVEMSEQDIVDIHVRNGTRVFGSDPGDGYTPSIDKKTIRKYTNVIDTRLPEENIAAILNASVKLITTEDYFRGEEWHCSEKGVINMTLPTNTILNVNRIYIRQGLGEYDSITFNVDDCPISELKSKKMKGGLRKGTLRFWAKLDDVNTIRCNIL